MYNLSHCITSIVVYARIPRVFAYHCNFPLPDGRCQIK